MAAAPGRRRGWSLAVLVAVLVAVLGPGLLPSTTGAGAQEPPAEDPLAPYLELVAPIASPVCADAALVNFVIPVALGAELSALVAQLISPVFVVCGSVPLPDGSRTCAIDEQVRGPFDELLASTGMALPLAAPGVGSVVDVVARIEDRVDLADPTLAPTLDAVLQCTQATTTPLPPLPDPPPAAPAPTPASVIDTPPLPAVPVADYVAPPLPPVSVAVPEVPSAVPAPTRVAVVSTGPLPFRYPVVFVLPLALLALGGAMSRTLTQPVAVTAGRRR